MSVERACSLAAARAPSPDDDRDRKARRLHPWRVELRDLKTHQALFVVHDEPLAAYWFVDPEQQAAAATLGIGLLAWTVDERRPDGVLIGERDGVSWVCFVELKSSLEHKDPRKQVPAEHALDQVAGSAKHFHPSPRSHGRIHHDRFADRSDPLEVVPEMGHRVVGVVVAFRRVPRPPPRRALDLGTAKVPLRVVHLAMSRDNRVETTFTDLLRSASVL